MGEYKPIGREVLIQGYLRKAPSSKPKSKYQDLTFLCGGCRVLLEARWKKRFCIFYKIRRPTETQIFFEYYKNETDKYPRGCIDLNSCNCIYEQKACNRWPNVFGVKTTYQKKELDYVFSANSFEEMKEWISQLTKVLHMVPDHMPGSPLADLVRRSSSCQFTPRRLMAPTAVPPSSAKVSNFLMNSTCLTEFHSYMDRDLTEEYRTSFGEAAADDEDCYHTLPQADHAYVNLKDDGDAACAADFKNDQEVILDKNPRPDSVYFNVWDSSTVDVNIDDPADNHVAFHGNAQESEDLKTPKSRFEHFTEEPPSFLNENSVTCVSGTQLPKRSRTRTASSSSTLSSEDGNGDVEGSKDAEKSVCLDNNGEAEAATLSSNDSVAPVLGKAAIAKSKDTSEVTSSTNGSMIHYLDAENLDFSLHQRGGRGGATAIPAVPPKPAHLRRAVPTEIASTEIYASDDVGSNGYNELDPRSTKAFFMVTRKVFGDSDGA